MTLDDARLVRDVLANTETMFAGMAVVYTERAAAERPLSPEEQRRCAEVYAAAAERLRQMREQLDRVVARLADPLTVDVPDRVM